MSKNLDDLIKDFEKKSKKAVSSKRYLWEGTSEDDDYCVDIHIWRNPGMGNSLQVIRGNKESIFTATASYLNTLLIKGVFTEKELRALLDMVIETHNEKDNS